MLKGLVIAALFALGITLGCSQKDGTAVTATEVPESSAPTASATVAAADVASDSATVQTGAARRTSPAGIGFVPLDNPTFLAADEGGFFGGDELVLGVVFAGEARAYPVRMLRYHHVINDVVGGEPLLVTY